jgi:hypothetical protein
MPASKALETSLVCTCSARFALPGDINDDFICDKVEKKSLAEDLPLRLGDFQTRGRSVQAGH